jgi:hypothetical protein
MKRAPIDWALVRTRLRASEAALEEAAADNPARLEAAYRERAVRLAKVEGGAATDFWRRDKLERRGGELKTLCISTAPIFRINVLALAAEPPDCLSSKRLGNQCESTIIRR